MHAKVFMKAMFRQSWQQVATQHQQVATGQVGPRLVLDKGPPRTTRASHAVPDHPSGWSRKQQRARRDQPGHAAGGAKICARTRAGVPRPASAARVHMARSGPVLACVAHPQALAAWRRDSPHVCSDRSIAPASSARAGHRTRSQSVRAAVQAIFRQDGLAEAASGLGEVNEGEESDESSGDALDCSRGGGGAPAIIEMVAACRAASAQLFDRLGGRSGRGGGRGGARFSGTGHRGGGRVPIVRRHGRDQRTGRSAQEVAAARREAHRLHRRARRQRGRAESQREEPL